MSKDPLNDRLSADAAQTIKDTISSVSTTLKKVESRRTLAIPEPWGDDNQSVGNETVAVKAPTKPEAVGKVALKEIYRRPGSRRTYVPAGECPFRPEGYNKEMYNYAQPTSDEVVQNWAIRVYNSGTDNDSYHPHAVVYWARHFWDMNDVSTLPDGTKVFGKEWRRIRDLILEALTPAGADHESAED